MSFSIPEPLEKSLSVSRELTKHFFYQTIDFATDSGFSYWFPNAHMDLKCSLYNKTFLYLFNGGIHSLLAILVLEPLEKTPSMYEGKAKSRHQVFVDNQPTHKM